MSTITNVRKYFKILFFSTLISVVAVGQENSPYSRFGLGDDFSSQNILNRGMGGATIAYYDLQTVNINNPASYARLKLTTFDVGIDYTSRRLRTSNTAQSFQSAYMIPSYLILGLPLSKSKNWGMVLGMRPDTKINYDLTSRRRLPSIDSVADRFIGDGGTYRAFTGFAYGTKNFSIGFNTGYIFGNKNFSTKRIFVNDTIAYQPARYTDSSNFGGFFFQGGAQYQIPLSKKTHVRLGMTYGLDANLNAKRRTSRETYAFGSRGEIIIDSVYKSIDEKGTIILPGTIGFAVLLENADKFLVTAELTQTQWSTYRYYGTTDALKDSWTFRLGTQIIPDIDGNNYWGRVSYRAGFYYGPDKVDIGTKMNNWAFTFGFGLPVRRTFYTNQFSALNLGFELGGRGNKQNAIRENLFRFSLGFNLSDIWFNKRTYQ
ncbi:MAG: hypothetical protein ACK45S_06590 [Sphingobacteriales bacterium]